MKWAQTSIASFTPSNVTVDTILSEHLSWRSWMLWKISFCERLRMINNPTPMIYIVCQRNSKTLWEGFTSVVIQRDVAYLVKSNMESIPWFVLDAINMLALGLYWEGFQIKGVPERNFELKNWGNSMHSLAVIWYIPDNDYFR